MITPPSIPVRESLSPYRHRHHLRLLLHERQGYLGRLHVGVARLVGNLYHVDVGVGVRVSWLASTR